MAEEQKLASGSGALQNVFGTGDENIRLLEKLMRVRVALRGGDIVVEGEEERDVDNTREILKKLCALAEKGERVDTAVVQYAVSLLEKGELDQLDNLYGEIVATTFRGRPIRCKTLGQREYVRAIRRNTLTFGVGPAGTGKTYLAMAMAVAALKSKEVERIVPADLARLAAQPGPPSAPAEDEQSCRKALTRAERRLRRLYELYAEDEDDTLRDAIARAKQDRDRASEALLAAQQRAGQDAEKEDALGALRTVGAQWDSLDAREKQSLVRACVDRIVLRNDRIEIFYAIEGAERSEVRAG